MVPLEKARTLAASCSASPPPATPAAMCGCGSTSWAAAAAAFEVANVGHCCAHTRHVAIEPSSGDQQMCGCGYTSCTRRRGCVREDKRGRATHLMSYGDRAKSEETWQRSLASNMPAGQSPIQTQSQADSSNITASRWLGAG